MNNYSKTSRSGIICSIILLGASISIYAATSSAGCGSIRCSGVGENSPSPATVQLPPAGGSTLSDSAAKLEIAGRYIDDDANLQGLVLPNAYKLSQWKVDDSDDKETGEPSHGYLANDLFEATDFAVEHDGQHAVADDLSNIYFIWRGEQLRAGIHLGGGATFQGEFDTGGVVSSQINIVFDLPSGGHRYIKATGFLGDQGGVIFDVNSAPDILAGVMTSTYMHVYVPIVGERKKREFMFYNDSFKKLLKPEDRKQVEDAQAKEDKKFPIKRK